MDVPMYLTLTSSGHDLSNGLNRCSNVPKPDFVGTWSVQPIDLGPFDQAPLAQAPLAQDPLAQAQTAGPFGPGPFDSQRKKY